MCTVSVMADYGRTRIAPEVWTQPVWNEYQEILKRLGDLDKKLGEPDCESEDKTEWMKAIEERLAKIEAGGEQ